MFNMHTQEELDTIYIVFYRPFDTDDTFNTEKIFPSEKAARHWMHDNHVYVQQFVRVEKLEVRK